MVSNHRVFVWISRIGWPIFTMLCALVAIYATLSATAAPREFPREFYTVFRIVVTAWSLLAAAVVALRLHNSIWVALVGIAIVFNPVREFFLAKSVWAFVDLGAALAALAMMSFALRESWRILRK